LPEKREYSFKGASVRRFYSSLILAQTALAMDIEPIVYFLGQALDVDAILFLLRNSIV